MGEQAEDVQEKDVYDEDEEVKTIAGLNRNLVFAGVGGVAVIALVIVFIVSSCSPKKGSIMYGVCNAFVELSVPYPETLERSLVMQFSKSVRIYFFHIDAFGEHRQEFIECLIDEDALPNLAFKKILRNREEVDPEIVRKFNMTIPAIIAIGPDTTLPEVDEEILKYID